MLFRSAHKKFMLTAFAPSLLNLTLIASFAYSYVQSETSVWVLGLAVLLGGALQVLILIPTFLQLRIPYAWSVSHIWSEPVRRVLKAFLPSVLGLGIVQIMALINTNYASNLQEGAVTFISLADRLLELPLSLVAVSLGTAILPSLSEHWSRQDHEGFAGELQKNMRALLFLCVPASVGLYMVAPLAVSVLYERGRFSADHVIVVSSIVKIYSITLVAAAVTRVLSQAYYAKKNTVFPAVAAGLGLVLHLFLAPQLMITQGLNGLVISTAVAASLNGLLLFTVLIMSKGFLMDWSFISFLVRCSLASVPMYIVGWWVQQQWPVDHFMMKVVELILIVGLSGAVYFLGATLMKLPESESVLKVLRRKLRI